MGSRTGEGKPRSCVCDIKSSTVTKFWLQSYSLFILSLKACFSKMSSLPKFNLSPMLGRRNRTVSENSESGVDAAQDAGVSYDMDGKFTFSKVMNCNMHDSLKTTVDENGKFSYMSADMRPVPPGWYNIDKTKHRVPVGWYQMGQQNQKGK